MESVLHTVNPNAWPGAVVLVALIIAGVWVKVAPRGGADDVKYLVEAVRRLDDALQEHIREYRAHREADRDRHDALRRELQAEATGPHRGVRDDLRDGGDDRGRDDRARRHRK